MQNQANEQARQNNMPMDQFESDSSSSESSSESGERKEGSKSSKDAKPSKNPGKEKPEKRNEKRNKNTQYINPEDEGEDEDWFKMKSESGTGAEIDSLDDVPAEYRGLVRDYFKALNEGGKK